MLWKLVLLFTLVPTAELVLLVTLGSAVGAVPTVGLCILTGVVGAWLARLEGLETLRRAQQALGSNIFPAREIAEGAAVLVGAALLLTPGLLTDVAGFALIVPLTRGRILDALKRRWDLSQGIVEVSAVDVSRWDED